jgi:hypothetical protein
MSIFGSIGSFFKKIGVGIGKAFVVAGGRGLTDEVLALAIEYVRSYVDSTLTNDQKREAVVRLLMTGCISPSPSRGWPWSSRCRP